VTDPALRTVDSGPPTVHTVRGLGLRARLLVMSLVTMMPPVLVATMVDLRNDGWPGALLLAGAFAAGGVIAYAAGTYIVRPVEALIQDAHVLSAGLSGHRSVIRSSDEVGQLAVALNQMAETMERRTAALADNERRYRFLFDSNPLPMWAWDAETTNILAVNQAAIDKYGYNREHFLTLQIVDLIDPSEMERFSGARLPFSEARQNAGSWMHRTATGKRLEMEVITTSSRRLGRASWLSVGMDITARREAERALARSEEQLRQAQKMEAIGTFAGGISHDFNNLLTGMLGYCDLLLSQLNPSTEAFADVNEIRALAVRGTELSRQILAVSRKAVLQPAVLDPNAIVLGLDRLLRRLVGEHIALHTHLDSEVGTVRADAGQLEQALLNLVSNARDAMPSGGRIDIRVGPISPEQRQRFTLDAQTEWTSISVADNGTGMSDDVKAHIFEPFFTTKARGKGSGLGLALACSMVERAGGEIRVESTLGVGTTMHLLLPRLDETVERPSDADQESGSLAGTETILLAEDEDAVRTVATAALERRGYRVLAAANGDAALAISLAFPGRIDLLVTDVVMPGMNGRALADRLVMLRPGLPVLYVSGYTDDEVLRKGISADERTLLAKPFTSLELSRRVRTMIDGAAV